MQRYTVQLATRETVVDEAEILAVQTLAHMARAKRYYEEIEAIAYSFKRPNLLLTPCKTANACEFHKAKHLRCPPNCCNRLFESPVPLS
jgi:hypothetical protein